MRQGHADRLQTRARTDKQTARPQRRATTLSARQARRFAERLDITAPPYTNVAINNSTDAIMGKPTGFKEFDRKKVPWRLPVVRINDYDEIYTEPRVEQLARARCPLHGLWCSVLPVVDRLSDRQFDSRMERLGLHQSLERGESSVCTRRTTFPSSPGAPAPHPAKVRACWESPIHR